MAIQAGEVSVNVKQRGYRTLKGGLVNVDDKTGKAKVIQFHYNPETMKRSLKPRTVGGEKGQRSLAVRFAGAPEQSIDVTIELDAADKLEKAKYSKVGLSIYPELCALELLIYPSLSEVNQRLKLLKRGVIQIAPLTAPRTLFVWGPKRVLPVCINSYSITEQVFDGSLNPIRAEVALSMQVITYSDISSDRKEYNQFKAYQQELHGIAGSVYIGKNNNLGVDIKGL